MLISSVGRGAAKRTCTEIVVCRDLFNKACLKVAHLKESFTCYGIDLRGYGESPTGTGPDSLYFGSDVATVMSTLALQGRVDLAS